MRSRPTDLAVPGRQTKQRSDLVWATILLLSFSIRWPNFGLVPVSVFVGLTNFRRAYLALGTTQRWTRNLAFLTIIALAVGALFRLTISAGVGHSADLSGAVEVGIWILSIPVLGIGGAYALGILGLRRGLVLFAFSSLAGNWLYYGPLYTHDLQTIWKYSLGYSITLLVVLVAASGRTFHLVGTVTLASGLAATSMILGSRSLGLVIGIAALLALPRRKERGSPTSVSATRHTLGTIFVVSAVAWFLSEAMKLGWFGVRLQQSYIDQTAHGNNFLLGGRTESAATFQLMQMHPLGFGLGTRPSDGFLREAVAAVARAGGDVYSSYYPTVVFGRRVDLHSMTADLWFHGGLGGLALATCVGLILVLGSVSATRTHDPTRLVCQILIWQAIWDLAFSPMANIDELCAGLMVAILFLARKHVRTAGLDVRGLTPALGHAGGFTRQSPG